LGIYTEKIKALQFIVATEIARHKDKTRKTLARPL
jgi:hypothetical protein